MDAAGSCCSNRLALVIVSYRSECWLPRCLETVYSGEFEGRCWLIDNDSLSSGLRDDLLARYPLVSYHRTGENLGFGGANNLGIQFAVDTGADIVGLINPDIWLEPGWCPAIVAAFEKTPGVGLVAPLQLRYENDEPAEWTRGALGIKSLGDPRLSKALIHAEWLEASAAFIKREVFEAIGGFDPLFKLYYEDNDLCRRARLAGFAHAVVPAARYHHFGGATLDGRWGTKRRVLCDLGQVLYTLTEPGRSGWRNLFDFIRLVGRRMRSWLAGEYQGYPKFLWNALLLVILNQQPIYRKRQRDIRLVKDRAI